MSDFWLPDGFEPLVQDAASDIDAAWDMLTMACIVKNYSIDLAELQVNNYHRSGMSTIEAIYNVYHEVVRL